jgi:SAM-dependent methyltransferase
MAQKNELELLWQTRTVELNIGISVNTLRNINILAEDLDFPSTAEFLTYLGSKHVADIGSGFNGLAIDTILRGLPVQVTSINPTCTNPRYEFHQKDKLVKEGYLYYPDYSAEEKEAARLKANRQTYPYFAHDIRLPDGMFDLAIDSTAVFYYSDYTNPLALAKSIEEMVRICKRGRTIRVADGLEYGKETPNWKEQILISMGLTFTPKRHGVEILT